MQFSLPFLTRLFAALGLAGALLFLAACSSIEYAPDKLPRMLVLNDQTPFYLHGPAQGNGADRLLAKGDEVQVLRKDFGYSFVTTSDGQKGYVDNDSLVTAPPEPPAPPRPSPTPEEKIFSGEPNTPATLPGFRY